MSVHHELIESYLAGPAILRKAVADMTPEQLRARPIPGKWSTAEVVFHLAEFEPVYVDRMKRAIALNKPLVFVADETEYVKHLAYDHRDVNEELALIDITRVSFARILKNIPEAAFQRVAVHNEKGLVTVEAMLKSVTNHILNHLPFIHEKRKALGLPAV
jgi:uncharacterized damage-inducible protein DinB